MGKLARSRTNAALVGLARSRTNAALAELVEELARSRANAALVGLARSRSPRLKPALRKRRTTLWLGSSLCEISAEDALAHRGAKASEVHPNVVSDFVSANKQAILVQKRLLAVNVLQANFREQRQLTERVLTRPRAQESLARRLARESPHNISFGLGLYSRYHWCLQVIPKHKLVRWLKAHDVCEDQAAKWL